MRSQLALLIEGPNFLRILEPQDFRREAPEVAGHILHVPGEHHPRAVVARRVHRLGQIDDHGPVGIHQHVELRQIPVDDPGAEHLHDLGDHLLVIEKGRFRR
jgi:hypothetical protein